MTEFDYDVVVVGSGFGGSVAALRLTEKGYRVGVLEAGRRFADDELPKSSWRVRRYLWAPRLRCLGLLRMTLLKDTFILTGSGVGGGSLVYANTLYRPLEPFFHDPQWAHITDWKAELTPYLDQAERMLGVVEAPNLGAADVILREVAEDMGRVDTFHPTRVGVLFGGPGLTPGQVVPDPYFGGLGPDRNTCLECGECCVGCRHNAKNTTVKNYLYLAEQAGAEVHPLTTVRRVRPLPDGGYAVETVRSGGFRRQTFTTGQVVFAAAALGTQKLLHRMRDEGLLPNVSHRLGHLTRTNSEAVLYPRSLRDDVDFHHGVAIESSIHPDDVTHIEVGRMGGRGSNLLSLTTTVMADPEPGRPRFVSVLKEMARNWRHLYRILTPRHWSEQSIGVLVMQTTDNSLVSFTKRGLFGRRMTTRPGPGEPPPRWIPIAHDVARRIAEKIDGVAKGTWFDVANIPSTAHYLGGCTIGDSPQTGVVDAYQRVYGHPGLHLADGSAVAANLGVNPSLTITAQAERAMAFWPNKGDPDQRPPLGSGYQRLQPVRPAHPVVPVEASGALRLPIWPVTPSTHPTDATPYEEETNR